MRVEHKSTDNTILPRSWWNSEDARMRDLTDVKNKLDRQEKAWNAMLYYWERSGSVEQVPPKSPEARQIRKDEVIKSFP